VSRPLGVAETAARLAAYAHALREAVHVSTGRLALEPRLEFKLLLADHVYDDARAVSKLRRRLDELGRDPGGAGPRLAAVLDRAAVYEELKPALIAALRDHLERLDPLADEPSLRLLTQLRHRQERHMVELGPSPVPDRDPLPSDGGEHRRLDVQPPLAEPARDAFVTLAAEHHPVDRAQHVHALMNTELCAAELAARRSHEHPGGPWDFHVDMARQAADCARHVAALDRLLTELGAHWGDHPVTLAAFRDPAQARGPRMLADDPLLDYLAADWAAHERANARWR
jgi:hypothetical protein